MADFQHIQTAELRPPVQPTVDLGRDVLPGYSSGYQAINQHFLPFAHGLYEVSAIIEASLKRLYDCNAALAASDEARTGLEQAYAEEKRTRVGWVEAYHELFGMYQNAVHDNDIIYDKYTSLSQEFGGIQQTLESVETKLQQYEQSLGHDHVNKTAGPEFAKEVLTTMEEDGNTQTVKEPEGPEGNELAAEKSKRLYTPQQAQMESIIQESSDPVLLSRHCKRSLPTDDESMPSRPAKKSRTHRQRTKKTELSE